MSNKRVRKTYQVTGYAMIPVMVETTVDAYSADEAKQIANARLNRPGGALNSRIVPGTHDPSCAHDFRASSALAREID